MITCTAYAKVNLALEVVGRRSDGYHEIVTLLQTVSLHDTVRVAPAADLSLSCDVPALAGADNLALRAAVLLQQRCGARQGAAIHLQKRIPVAAGLGGGSSDAAATLLALAELWHLEPEMGMLAEVATALGSDVPFFLWGGTALAGGRGERLEALPPAPARWLVLLRPPVMLPGKTALLYRRLSPADFGDGATARAAAAAVREGRFPADELLVNTFERVADAVFPGLAAARASLQTAAGGRPVHLSGAGPTLFAVFADREPAVAACRRLLAEGNQAYLVRSVPARSRPRGTEASR